MAGSRLYTRTGDTGQTTLGQGRRVPKTNGTLEVLGNVDELTGSIGLARAALPADEAVLKEELLEMQRQLNRLKEDLASSGTVRSLTAYDTESLEKLIDLYAPYAVEKDPALIPGTTGLAANLDIARSIARRLERSLSKAGLPSAVHMKYVNRLSDALYSAARYLDAGSPDAGSPAGKGAAPSYTDSPGVDMSKVLTPAPSAKSLPLKLVKSLLEAVEIVAENQGLKLVMAACDEAGRPIAVHVMDDAFIASYDIAVNKAWTAVSLKMPTKELAELCKPGGSLYGLQHTNNGKVVIFGGGVPLKDRTGRIIGGFGVSGSTAEIDTRMGDIGGEIFDQLYEKMG